MHGLRIARASSLSSKSFFSSNGSIHSNASIRTPAPLSKMLKVHAYSVQIEQNGNKTILDVPEGDSILSVAIDAGMEVPHDCKLGVCMNCAARLVSGEVDQSAGMLSDDVKAKGYVLLCMAIPQGDDVVVEVIEEEELLEAVMGS